MRVEPPYGRFRTRRRLPHRTPCWVSKFGPVPVNWDDRQCTAVRHDVSRVPPPALPDLRPALRLVLLGRSSASKNAELLVLRHEVAPAAPHQAQTPPRPGRPSRHGRADPVPAREAASTPPGHPGTVLRWHRRLVTRKWTYPRGAGRPPASAEIAALTGRLAAENRGWGYQRMQGELLKLANRVSASAIRRVLKVLTPPPRHRSGTPTRRGGSSCARRPRQCSPPTSSTWTARSPSSACTACSSWRSAPATCTFPA